MSLLPTTIPNVATGFNTSSISPLFKQLTSGGIQSTAGFENLLGNLKSPGDPSNFSWLQRPSAKLNNIFSTLNKGLGNAATKAVNNANTPMGIIAGAAEGVGNSVMDMFGVKRADNNSTVGKISQGITKSGVLPMLGPVGVGAQIGLTAFNWVDRGLGKDSKLDKTFGMDTLGYNIAQNPNAGKRYSLTSRRSRKFQDKITDWNTNARLIAGTSAYEQRQNQLASGNTSQYLGDKNILNLQGGMNQYNQSLLAKKGGIINPAQLRSISQRVERKLRGGIIEEVKEEIQELKDGGKVNVIPEGALHARLHDLPEEIADQVTKKGIPVVTEEEGGKLLQHAEIERDEIIFRKEATDKIEELHKKYKEAKTEKEKNKIAIECGKYLTEEILFNTEDNTGLLGKVGENGK